MSPNAEMYIECPECGGTGTVKERRGIIPIGKHNVTCPRCDGDAKLSVPISLQQALVDADEEEAPCSQCGDESHRAYRKGLCGSCAGTPLDHVTCKFPGCDNQSSFRLPDGKPSCYECGAQVLDALVTSCH